VMFICFYLIKNGGECGSRGLSKVIKINDS
jgi:hypothetical protein